MDGDALLVMKDIKVTNFTNQNKTLLTRFTKSKINIYQIIIIRMNTNLFVYAIM